MVDDIHIDNMYDDEMQREEDKAKIRRMIKCLEDELTLLYDELDVINRKIESLIKDEMDIDGM